MSLAASAPALKTMRPPMQAGTCGQRIVAALPLLWAKWVSLHDAAGRIYWQQGEVLGPPEREAIRVALDSFVGSGAPARVNHPLQRDRTAILLRAEDDAHAFLGFVLLVVDDRWLRGKGTTAPDLPIPVVRAVREWGATLASGAQGPVPDIGDSAEIRAPQVAVLLEGAALSDCASQGASQGRPAQAGQCVQAGELLRSPEATRAAENSPRVDDIEADRYLEKLQSFQLELHAQRLTPIQAGLRIRRYEVLMRAAGQGAAGSAPEALIAGAQSVGLGAVLDRRVVGDLLVWLAQRREIWSGEPAQFSVNLSTGSLRDPHFLGFVRQCMDKAQLPRGLVAFEAQHEFCRREPACIAQLGAQLEQIGAGLVIDNFMLSESGVDLLLQPGVCLVKLDPGLTRALVTDRGRQARVAAIAQAARVAGVHAVAKHVECEQSRALLQALGVDFMQGFGVSVPAPLSSIDELRTERQIVDPVFGAAAEPATDSPAEAARLVAAG